MQRQGKKCPLDNKCITSNIIYESQITSNTNEEHKKYLTAAETSFKETYTNHTQDFKHEKYMKCIKIKIFLEFEESRHNTHS